MNGAHRCPPILIRLSSVILLFFISCYTIYLLHHDFLELSLAGILTSILALGADGLPKAYRVARPDVDKGQCAERYGRDYIRRFSRSATRYCNDDSASCLTCFTHKAHDVREDSFCFGAPAVLDKAAAMFRLNCSLRDWDAKLNSIPEYWYNTGPRITFRQHIKLEGDASADVPKIDPTAKPEITYILMQREGPWNMYHNLMQVMSMTLSMDVLHTTVDAQSGAVLVPEHDLARTQTVILDDKEDGPFFDLWGMLSGMPTIRLKDMDANAIPSKIVIPLPGASNPVWEGDWTDIPCHNSALLEVFSARILDHYNITKPPRRPQWQSRRPRNLTMINRTGSRRLVNQDECFKALKQKYTDLDVHLVDFTGMSFAEQIRSVRSTDILVGVHGAGMAHELFMTPESTVVEILPPKVDYRGFKNIANFLGHRYHAVKGSEHPWDIGRTGDWYQDNVFIDLGDFMRVMDEAITGKSRKTA